MAKLLLFGHVAYSEKVKGIVNYALTRKKTETKETSLPQTVPTITLFHICISKKAILIRFKMPLYSKQSIKDNGEMRKENHSDPLSMCTF